MNWEQVGVGTKSVLYQAESPAKSFDEAVPDFADFWRQLFHCIDVHRGRADSIRILLELWLNSGRLIAHPITRGRPDSYWSFAVQLYLPLIERLTQELANSELLESDKSFKLAQVRAKIRIALDQAAKSEDVFNFAQAVQQKIDVRIIYQTEDQKDTRFDLSTFLLFDNDEL